MRSQVGCWTRIATSWKRIIEQSAVDIINRLGLPPGPPLGRLRRTFGFSMADVRRVLESPARGIGTENEKNKTGDNR